MSAIVDSVPKMKPVLAFDMDEVLARFAHSLAQFHNDRYGSELREESFTSYHFHEVWGGTVADCNQKVCAFDHFFEQMVVIFTDVHHYRWKSFSCHRILMMTCSL